VIHPCAAGDDRLAEENMALLETALRFVIWRPAMFAAKADCSPFEDLEPPVQAVRLVLSGVPGRVCEIVPRGSEVDSGGEIVRDSERQQETGRERRLRARAHRR
jgi:hypothetical protein